jgi:hypothetical protein
VQFFKIFLVKIFFQFSLIHQLKIIISLNFFQNNSLNLFFIHHVTSHFLSKKFINSKSFNKIFFIVFQFLSYTQSVSQAKYQLKLKLFLFKKSIKSQKILSEEIIFQLFRISHHMILILFFKILLFSRKRFSSE